jgi:hypothetical protein
LRGESLLFFSPAALGEMLNVLLVGDCSPRAAGAKNVKKPISAYSSTRETRIPSRAVNRARHQFFPILFLGRGMRKAHAGFLLCETSSRLWITLFAASTQI